MNFYLDILANIIIQKYFLSSHCLIIFTDEFNTFDYTGDIPAVKISIQNESITEELVFHYFGCQGIIIKNNKPLWTFQTLEKLIRVSMERFNSRKYLILPGCGTIQNLTEIFDLEEMNYVSDIVVVEQEKAMEASCRNRNCMVGKEHVVYNLWTHQYVGGGNNNQKILLDSWSSNTMEFKNDNDLFPNKLKNQQRRILKIATFQYEPYSIIDLNEYASTGSEMSTALAFSKQYNMTPMFVVNANDYWGEIYDNWTGIGLLGNLVLDNADIGFAALYTWEAEYRFLDLSKPLVRTGITCLVPAPKLAAGWLTPLYSYSPQMWIIVGVLFFVCIFSLFSLHYFYSKTKIGNCRKKSSKQDTAHLFGYSVFSIIKLFVLQVVTREEMPPGANGTYFMGLLFLFSLFLTSTYSSGLSSIMTVPRYENPINTVQEFAESELLWGATQDAWISSIQNAEEPVYKEIVRRFIADAEDHLREFSKTGKYGFSLERLPRDNFAVGSYIKDDVIGDFHLMQEDLYWEQCVFMTRKSSILLPMIDLFVLRVFEAGLISYWQNEAVVLYMDSKVQQAVKYYYYHHKDRVIVKLKWSHVQGAFAALCLGYMLSVIVFCLEIFSNKVKNNEIKICW